MQWFILRLRQPIFTWVRFNKALLDVHFLHNMCQIWTFGREMIQLLLDFSAAAWTTATYLIFVFPAGEQRAQSDQPHPSRAAMPAQDPGSQSSLPSRVLHRRTHQLHRRRKHEPPSTQSKPRTPLGVDHARLDSKHLLRVRCVINSQVVLSVGPHPPRPPSSSAPPRMLIPPPLWSSSPSLCSAQHDKPPHPAVHSLIFDIHQRAPLYQVTAFMAVVFVYIKGFAYVEAGWVAIRLSYDLMVCFSLVNS